MFCSFTSVMLTRFSLLSCCTGSSSPDSDISLGISEEEERGTTVDSFNRSASSSMELVPIGCSPSELPSSLCEDISSSDTSWLCGTEELLSLG